MLIWYFSNNLDVYDYVGKQPEQHFSVCLFSNPGDTILFLLTFNEARFQHLKDLNEKFQSKKDINTNIKLGQRHTLTWNILQQNQSSKKKSLKTILKEKLNLACLSRRVSQKGKIFRINSRLARPSIRLYFYSYHSLQRNVIHL